MPTVTLASLLGTYTEDSLQTTQLSVLSTAGFPIDSWAPTSVPRVLVKADARSQLDMANTIPQIAAGGFIALGTGDWLTLKASSDYQAERSSATFAVRSLTLTDSSASPTSVTTGTVWALSADGLRYLLAEDGVVPSSGSVTLRFQAEESGEDYNAASASWTLETPLPGIEVTETAAVTTLGEDQESDDALRARCIAKWGSIGAGANDAAYRYWATNTPEVTEVRRVKVRDAYPLPGQVTIYLAGANGTVSSTDSLGTVTQTGSGPAMTLTGTPTDNIDGKVVITAPGILGIGEFKYSTDGGTTYSGSYTLTTTHDIPGTGVTLNLAAGLYVLGTTYEWNTVLSPVTMVQDYIDPASHLGKSPNCVDVFVQAAAETTLAPIGVITVSSGTYVASVDAALSELFSTLASEVQIGGTVYLAEFVQRVMDLPGVVNVEFTTPAADVTLGANAVLVVGSISGLTIAVE